MSDQFLGEIRLFPFNFAPYEWATCSGQILPLSQNTALFALLGTQYGGNGTSTFALPNLQGRVALDQGSGLGLTPRTIGEIAGSATVTLLASEIPAHTHGLKCATTVGNAANPSGNSFGSAERGKPPGYAATGGAALVMNPSAVGNTGGGEPHDNMQPYLTMNYCIALTGIFPSRG
ncbi:MAG: tail fiber protein [Terracidiphilus sp.]